MILSHLNYLAVLVATIIYFGIGGLWYSPLLFVKAWAAGHGIIIPTDEAGRAAAMKDMPKYMAITFVACFLGTVAIGYLETAANIHHWMGGVKIGIIAGFFAALSLGLGYMHTKKSLRTWIIDSGYHVVGLIIVGVILAVWH